jgi:hypothetical protein
MTRHRLIVPLFVAALAGASLFTGCAPTALMPGAERVRITQEEPKGCEYLGEVIGDQGGSLSGPLTSNANLERGALNDLKNRAFQMGGTVVYLISNRAGQTSSFNREGGSSQQTNVVYVGAVYRCRDN